MILLGIVSLVYLLMQAWILTGWFLTKADSRVDQMPVSVIIAAHNELPNLQKYLPLVFRQQYPEYEVVIVLDRCDDGSKEWLEQWAPPGLKIIEITRTPEGWASKKWAITRGIKAASHENLVFTDADCRVGENWLQSVAQSFGKNTEVILGISPYEYRPGLLNLFIRFETFYTFFQYIGLAKKGLPYMAVGRNLAYRKSFFVRNGGLERVKDRLSGDDDLLVNAFADSQTTVCMIHPESHVYSEPKTTFRSWLRQKFRHVSASRDYSWQSKVFLAIFHGSHSLFYLIFLKILLTSLTGWSVFALYTTRIFLSWGIFLAVENKVRIRSIIYLYPVLDFLFFIYNLSAIPIGLIRKPAWT